MINLNELRQRIRKMTRQQGLYKVLRDELTAKGYWKKLKRGKPNPNFRRHGTFIT